MPNRSENLVGYRFGFNGQEADNEVYGDKASYAFEFRNYDARLGRFWSIDPLWQKFPWNSSYAFAENRVIDGIELEGLEVVVLFGGADLSGNGNTGIAKDIRENIKDKLNGGTAILVNSNYTKPIEVVLETAKEVVKSYEPGKPVIIYGYSKGGEYATMLADQLSLNNIAVDLLITVDAADGPFSIFINRTISENVKKNINYYQRSPSRILSRGDENKAKNPSKTNVENINLTGKKFEDSEGNTTSIRHATIDNGTQKDVEQNIIDEITNNK
jgi:RHS repeat-associated protein